MSALFLLAAEYRAAAQTLADLDTDPQTLADKLESISGDLETKAQSVAYMVRAIESDAEAMKAWARAASERAAAAMNRAEHLREYLTRCMDATGIERIEGPGIKLSFRKSSGVVIDGADLLPADMMRQPETPPAVPDKKAIHAAITAGRDVPGAHVEHRRNLVIA